MVFQHFSLFDTLTAAENVWLGLDKSFSAAAGHRAHRGQVAHEYGLDVDPLRPVHTCRWANASAWRSCAR
jgi:ABC-type uncharacterized transport system ATPase subunit